MTEQELRRACEDSDVDYEVVVRYKEEHPELSYDYIVRYCKCVKKSLHRLCSEAGVSYATAHAYIIRNTGATNKQAILYYNPDFEAQEYAFDEKLSLRKKCFIDGADYGRADYYKRRYNLSDEDAIELAFDEKLSLRKKCFIDGVDYNRACYYKRRDNLSDEDAIELAKSKPETLKSKCKKEDVRYGRAISYRANHPELSDEQVLEICKTPKVVQREVCENLGLPFYGVATYMSKHKVSFDEAIEHSLEIANKKGEVYKECAKNNVSYVDVMRYWRVNPWILECELVASFIKDVEKGRYTNESFEAYCRKVGVPEEEMNKAWYLYSALGRTKEEAAMEFLPGSYINAEGELVVMQDDFE